jgi:hypothetical protein
VPELRRIARLLREDFSDAELAAAAEWGSFENLSRLEQAGYFRSGGYQKRKSDPPSPKARRGRVGGFREDLLPSQVAELEAIVTEKLSPSFGYGKPESLAPTRSAASA